MNRTIGRPPGNEDGPEATTPQGRPTTNAASTATITRPPTARRERIAPMVHTTAGTDRPSPHQTTLVDDPEPGRTWRDLWGPMKANASREGSARKERVLAHTDLAERLTRLPLKYARPDQWNGYVPPKTWQGRANDSARRAALVEICAEALRRELAEAG